MIRDFILILIILLPLIIIIQYYATREHAENAWNGIIHKIAAVLGPLRSSPDMIGSDVDRVKRTQAMEVSICIHHLTAGTRQHYGWPNAVCV